MTYKDHIKTPYWASVSKAVKARAGWKCQVCNSPHDLNAHHRTYDHMGYELEHLDDIVCLCRRCHAIFHGKDIQDSAKSKKTGRSDDRFSYNHEADMPDGDPIILTPDLKERLYTKSRGVTNATISALGVKPPLKSGWFRSLIGKEISRESFRKALQGREKFGTRLEKA